MILVKLMAMSVSVQSVSYPSPDAWKLRFCFFFLSLFYTMSIWKLSLLPTLERAVIPSACQTQRLATVENLWWNILLPDFKTFMKQVRCFKWLKKKKLFLGNKISLFKLMEVEYRVSSWPLYHHLVKYRVQSCAQCTVVLFCWTVIYLPCIYYPA